MKAGNCSRSSISATVASAPSHWSRARRMWTCYLTSRRPSPAPPSRATLHQDRRQRRLRAPARAARVLPRHRQAPPNRLGGHAAGSGRAGDGHGRRLEAGQMARCSRRPGGARRAGGSVSVPGFPLPDRERSAGREGKTPATTGLEPFPAASLPGPGGNAQTQQRRDFPGFPAFPLYRERVSIGNAPPSILPRHRSCPGIDEHGTRCFNNCY